MTKKITDYTALTGAGTASGDLIEIVDVSATANKKITADELAIATTALRVAGVYQPLDSDLTAIAALTTTTLGRSILTAVIASAYTQTYNTVDRTHANPTAAALTVTDGTGTNNGTIDAITDNASTIAAVQEIAAMIAKLVADIADVKQIVNAVIDDLQALGLVG